MKRSVLALAMGLIAITAMAKTIRQLCSPPRRRCTARTARTKSKATCALKKV